MRRAALSGCVAVLLGCGLSLGAEAKAEKVKPAGPARHIDLAVCLDTSNSMDGLIGSAKQKLWAIVNELATAKPTPALRVGLYQYGNNGLNREVGWVQRVCDLTDDLDTVYEKLFKLTTNGGTEYVARVMRAATEELKWNADKNALRIIFVAGNEPATQDGKHKLQDTCAAAAAKGIIVNTIFCGPADRGRQTGWADAARWADGQYAAIDQDRGTVVVNTPYDKKLAELSGKLNRTYVAYGPGGGQGAARQVMQDSLALKLGASVAAERANAKASGLYRSGKWDLVDAVKEKKVELEKIGAAELPEEMKKMTLEQRKAHLAKQAAERDKIRKEIGELSGKRQAHVKSEMSKRGLSDEKSFDAVLRAFVRSQAEAKGFEFKKPQAPTPEKSE